MEDGNIHVLGTGFQTACSPTIVAWVRHIHRRPVELADGQLENSMINSFISLVT